jgi:hypothetical protein
MTGEHRHPHDPQAPLPTKAGRGDSLPRHILEEVLRVTATALESGGAAAIPDAELRELRNIAQCYAGRPLELDPILIEMVSVVIARHFPSALTADEFAPMARWIAESLFEDPLARERAERLWKRLSETTA